MYGRLGRGSNTVAAVVLKQGCVGFQSWDHFSGSVMDRLRLTNRDLIKATQRNKYLLDW